MKHFGRAIPEGEIRAILVSLSSMSKDSGKQRACRQATSHLVAAAAFLDEQIGPDRTKKILAATMASLDAGTKYQ
jgi:hypothetical protein